MLAQAAIAIKSTRVAPPIHFPTGVALPKGTRMAVPDQLIRATRAGQAVHTRRTLDLNNPVVLGLSNPLIRKCPTRRLLDRYNRHIASRHLDVGVRTGWFLHHCRST